MEGFIIIQGTNKVTGTTRGSARERRRPPRGTKQGVACDYSGTPGTDHGLLPLVAFLRVIGGKAGTPACATKGDAVVYIAGKIVRVIKAKGHENPGGVQTLRPTMCI